MSYSAKPWTAALQASWPSRSPEVCPSSCPLHRIWGKSILCDAIQPSHPLTSSSPALSLSQHQGLFQWWWYIHGVKYSVSKGKKFWCVPTWMNFANTMLSVKSQTEEDTCLPTRIVVSYDSVYLKNCQTVLQSCYLILFPPEVNTSIFLICALFLINCIKMFSFHFVSTLSLFIMLYF